VAACLELHLQACDKLFSAIQRDLMTAIEEDLRRTLAGEPT
jgi:hypothetical protein